MTSETLEKAVRARPFVPFTIHLADGRSIPVPHPELIAYKVGSLTAVVVDGDSFEYIDLLLATGLRMQNIEDHPVGRSDGSYP